MFLNIEGWLQSNLAAMTANKRNLGEILSQEIRLVAPLFQRPYVWKQEENWVPLWQAIEEVSNRRLVGVTVKPYFMGALVLDQIPNSVGTVPSREIIDGQQRMTTLQILFEVARRIFAERSLDHAATVLSRFTRNELEVVSDEQFKVWPTNSDRAAFKAVMTNQPAKGLLQEAAQFFYDKVSSWLSADPSTAKEMASGFIAAIRSDLVFVAIDLDNDDDGQLIFETLNSLGTPLLPSDLVKNLLFRQAMAEKLDTENLYADYWEQFEKDSSYWRGEVRVGRRERPRLDVFLQYFLTYSLSKEPALPHQFRDYRDSFRDGKFGTTEEAIRSFAHHAKLFREFDEAPNGTVAGSLRHVLTVQDASVPNPLVLGIFANVAPGEERDRMLGIIESYLVRRMLMAATVKNLNRVTAELISKLRSDGWTADNLTSALLAYEGGSTVWPTDEAIMWRQTERNAYGDIRGIGISYVLSRVEQSMRSGKSELGWNVRTPLTIEHLMPQKWEDHWPLENPENPDAIQTRRDMINRLGNLTVLTQRLNSSVSNASWASKRKHLNDHTVLLINSALAQSEAWDEDLILERSRVLAMKFCELWPRPQGAATPVSDFEEDEEVDGDSEEADRQYWVEKGSSSSLALVDACLEIVRQTDKSPGLRLKYNKRYVGLEDDFHGCRAHIKFRVRPAEVQIEVRVSDKDYWTDILPGTTLDFPPQSSESPYFKVRLREQPDVVTASALSLLFSDRRLMND